MGGASAQRNLTGSFLTGPPDGMHNRAGAGQPLPPNQHVLPQTTDYPQPAGDHSHRLTSAEAPEEDVPISQLKGHPEKLREGEDGGARMQVEESAEHGMDRGTGHHEFGHGHGYTQHEYGGYEELPQYEGHQQYAATAEAQQLAEHAGEALDWDEEAALEMHLAQGEAHLVGLQPDNATFNAILSRHIVNL